jgi:hypothetical protein
MIKNIIDMLQLDAHVAKHEYIEIAKGKYKIPKTIKEGYKQAKRELIMKKKTNG